MPLWLVVIFLIVGGLIAVKMLHAIAVVSVFPVTQGAMFTSTARVKIRTVLDAVPMKPPEFFVDLGCGDGRALRETQRRYGVRCLGFEINPLAYALARIRCLGSANIRVLWRNFWKEDLRDADVVFCYLFPDVMRRLAGKLESELRPGARVVSCNFPLPRWHPLEVLHAASTLHNDPIYVYRIPESLPRRLSEGLKPGREGTAPGPKA
ncbi:MAG TPA: class I SAM-dependent methyltransferase [Syntrophales bacterium]|nr:class I SAM-dependent methyltransferase [Syntrophales bacterium]HOX93599.1 class I SAM-dependent methyltransferase [Syntrophales bacterium]HPI56894.1 class I SAM-dependent methyltransferase [Syntrophales bacterium]HPN23480.1 class I SAM-dependent methyltransferase [Syntrophales bacterium]HQM27995.1 class I SAM-dependent methyltransferase [Syntrophales bacterium]